MRKTIIVALSLFVAGASMAQSKDGAEQIQNKNGKDMMPEKGDFGLGINVLPVFSYIGSLFGKNNNTYLDNGWNKFATHFGANTLYGKYMITEKSAIRFNFRVGVINATTRYEVYDDTQTHPDYKVEDMRKNNNTDVNIGAGYEWRRGKNKFRGIYGVEAMYTFNSGVNSSYEYGNLMNDGNIAPTSIFNATGGQFGGNGSPVAERIISNKGGHYNGGGLRLFAGIEYFIGPKICLGTEFGYGLTVGGTGSSVRTTEYWDAATGELRQREFRTSSTTNFSLDTDNFNGAVYLMFYF